MYATIATSLDISRGNALKLITRPVTIATRVDTWLVTARTRLTIHADVTSVIWLATFHVTVLVTLMMHVTGQTLSITPTGFKEPDCTIDSGRSVETVGPVSPVGHVHLRSDSSTVLSGQMSERTPEYLKCYLGDISACIGPTVKYDP